MFFRNSNEPLTAEIKRSLQKNAHWYLMLGIGLVIVGTLALIFSGISTLFSMVYLGAALCTLGCFELFKALKIRTWSQLFLHLFIAIIALVAGIFIIMHPMLNAISLTLLLATCFVVMGLVRIIFALIKKVPHRGWLIFNGVVTFLLGVLIAYQWPFSGLWIIGMFVGIDMIFTGWTWIMLAMAAKKIE